AKKAKKSKKLLKKPVRQSKVPRAQVHPWRPCPLGKHWVRAHPKHKVSNRGKPYIQNVGGFCRTNPSHKDHLYADDIHEIADRHFSRLKGPPAASNLGFGSLGNKYDAMIRGWTRYWNEVLKPKDPLDPDVVKALIASESSFIVDKWNGLRGMKSARGLTQVLNGTIPLLRDSKELSNHLINLDEDDMLNPNLNICAGVRWLFRKKQLFEATTKKPASWRDAVAKYKGVSPDEKRLMPRFDRYLRMLKGKK
ncbi:MAG: transglycosylase SLT domain-containing protein, partial [Bdellovibrionota bacterium]